ncbi:hypothetical protein HanXRQr2_Chr16g0761491 [Helianthus annuus]|uniref:Uncharacterized protein n=1 Tax=Helianthus annuus TaxID=4232 RepID=A0A9K3DVB7_HELAN|nr:hypothetical protein HanXRQr2_Chr16g0761491 [Helianthus annuus]
MIWVQFEKTFERLNMFTNLPGVTHKVCEYKIIFSISQNPLSFPSDSSLGLCKTLLQGSRVLILLIQVNICFNTYLIAALICS